MTLVWVATRGSWPYYLDATLVLLGVPGLTTRRKRCLSWGRCVCVCNPWNHRDPFGFVRLAFCQSRGPMDTWMAWANEDPSKLS